MKLDDLVFLNRTVAQVSTKYGATYCSVAWSDTLRSLVRLYPLPAPLPADKRPHRWHVYSAALSRPANDTRSESWRVDGDLVPTGERRDREDMLAVLRKTQATSILALDQCRRSLGLIEAAHVSMGQREIDRATADGVRAQQGELFGMGLPQPGRSCNALMRGDIGIQPTMRFRDLAGVHELQLLSIGAFALLAKGYGVSDLGSTLRIGRPDTSHLLLVGNQAHHRNSWLVIESFPVTSTIHDFQPYLFDAEVA